MELNPRPLLFVEAVQKPTSGADRKVLANELAYFVKCKANVDVVCGQVKVNRKSLVRNYFYFCTLTMITIQLPFLRLGELLAQSLGPNA